VQTLLQAGATVNEFPAMLSGTTSSSNSSSNSSSSSSSGEVSLFDAAIATGDLPLLYEVYLRLQRTAWQQWQAKVPSVLQALQAMPVCIYTIHLCMDNTLLPHKLLHLGPLHGNAAIVGAMTVHHICTCTAYCCMHVTAASSHEMQLL
jgi:hypothetical protein